MTDVPNWLKLKTVIIRTDKSLASKNYDDNHLPQHATVYQFWQPKYSPDDPLMVMCWDMFDETVGLTLETVLKHYREAKPNDVLGEWCSAFKPGEGANSERVFLQRAKK